MQVTRFCGILVGVLLLAMFALELLGMLKQEGSESSSMVMEINKS